MNTKCAICIKPVQDSTNIIVAECGHTFHCLCLMTNVSFKCPLCQVSNDEDEDEDDVEDGFTPIYHFRRFLNADAVEDNDAEADDDADADNDADEEEEQWGAESDSCDEFGSGYGAVEDSDDDDAEEETAPSHRSDIEGILWETRYSEEPHQNCHEPDCPGQRCQYNMLCHMSGCDCILSERMGIYILERNGPENEIIVCYHCYGDMLEAMIDEGGWLVDGEPTGEKDDADDDDDDDTDADADDTNRLLQDDAMRGFRLFNNLLDGVDHDDDDNNDEDYYNIRCDPDESVADYNRRTGHHYNEDGYDDDGYDVYGNDDWGHNRRGRFHSLRLEPDEVQKRV